MTPYTALVQPVSDAEVAEFERRRSLRLSCDVEALTRLLDTHDTMCWGAVVSDISTGGLRLSVCYPFKPGSYLAVDLQGLGGASRVVLVRLIYVRDQIDGAWQIGCEFVRPLNRSEVETLV